MRREDGGLSYARLKSVSAPKAWAWKMVVPTSKDMQLTDTQYRIAARLNLGLLPIGGTGALPSTCPLCDKPNILRTDAWHFMTCKKLGKGEVNVRHDEVETALYRSALMMGLQAIRQPTGLDPKSDLRPDLMLILPGRRILTDVAICHPLAPGRREKGTSHRTLGTARVIEENKRKKYTKIKVQHEMELLPFVVETCGGVGREAGKLLKAMAEAGEEHLAIWPKKDIIRHLIGSVAMAVQRGGTMAYLEGHYKALRALSRQSEAGVEEVEEVQVEEETTEEEWGEDVAQDEMWNQQGESDDEVGQA
jgi:hypothetical protein